MAVFESEEGIASVMRRRLFCAVALMCVLCMLACACSQAKTSPGNASSQSAPAGSLGPSHPLFASFDPASAVSSDGMSIDYSHSGEGYVAASAVSELRLKFQVTHDGQTYNYDLPADGAPTIFPLQMGDGQYTFRIMINSSGDRYYEGCSATVDVFLSDEFAPFLRPNEFVDYDEGSRCLAVADELRDESGTEIELAGKIYEYVADNISYDSQLADTVQAGYIPSPDGTLESRKGICFDYASLTAAMMRSQGIPCKVVTGYVDGDLYHAWNIIYFEETGWITVEIEVDGKDWKRIDLTFAANSADDGMTIIHRYTDRYVY